jgi:hypothetical protein
MNIQRFTIFENDRPLSDQVKDNLKNVTENPHKLSLMFWFFRLQICIAVFILIMSILLPYFILYG